jgi:hypothetical protein
MRRLPRILGAGEEFRSGSCEHDSAMSMEPGRLRPAPAGARLSIVWMQRTEAWST